MNHVGVIFCAYATKDYLARSLAPWIALRKAGQIKVSICAVNVLFAGFEGKDDGTRELLHGYVERGEIDHLISGPDSIPETTARGMALTWLKEQGATLSWMVDSDEFYSSDDIQDIINVVDANPWCYWFRLCFMNYVFDQHTYLIDAFTPPRIHRMRAKFHDAPVYANSFIADNDIVYSNEVGDPIFRIRQDELASRTIPQQVAWIPHITWQNDLRSKAKIEYQLKGRGWPQCSFAWDDQKGLIFNPALPAPKIVREA